MMQVFNDPSYKEGEIFKRDSQYVPQSINIIDHLVLRGKWSLVVFDDTKNNLDNIYGLKFVSDDGREMEFSFTSYSGRKLFCNFVYSQYKIKQISGGTYLEPYVNQHVLNVPAKPSKVKDWLNTILTGRPSIIRA